MGNHPKGRDLIIDQFLYTPTYLNAIQTTCPHILRYLTTAVITNKQRRNKALKDLVKVIQQESYTYKDPITEFVQCLYVDFDFDGAQKKLRECETVLFNDFFLVACLEDFIQNARLDAKIDSKLGHVVMGTAAISPYQQVIEKTKNLSVRSQMLAFNIEKKLGNKQTHDNQWQAQEGY